jgi:hypothetical protein
LGLANVSIGEPVTRRTIKATPAILKAAEKLQYHPPELPFGKLSAGFTPGPHVRVVQGKLTESKKKKLNQFFQQNLGIYHIPTTGCEQRPWAKEFFPADVTSFRVSDIDCTNFFEGAVMDTGADVCLSRWR